MTVQVASLSALFIEESRQLLMQIEQGWQQAQSGDIQWRSQMLRQLHQLKGMAASFNQSAVADCCHQLETQLNQQDSAMSPEQAIAVSQTLCMLHDILHSVKYVAQTPAIETPEQITTANEQLWRIDFKPLPGFFANGQDPLHYLKQLQQLGDMTVLADTSQLPVFADFDASQPCLSWQVTLKTDVDEQSLWQLFDWVKELCQVNITALNEIPPPMQSPAPARQSPLNDIMRRHQQQLAWLQELQQAAQGLPSSLQNRLEQLQLAQSQNYLDLQKLMLKPLSTAYQRLPGLLQTICKQTGKQADLVLPSQPIWLPAMTLDLISDVLIQLLRNAIAHGIESPDSRLAAGKSPQGQIAIEHYLDGLQLKLHFYDDGCGLQSEKILAAAGENTSADIHELIFQAGLSTTRMPDLLAGRGIGLDLVRQHIQQLQGHISVASDNAGCAFHISIPLPQTLQVLQAVAVADQIFVVSPECIIADLPASSLPLRQVSGRGEFVEYQQQWWPVWDIRQRLKLVGPMPEDSRLLIMREQGRQYMLRVDKLLLPAEYLLSDVQRHYQSLPGVVALATNGGLQPALWLQWQQIFGERK
ncbi:MAG: Hpt domain-containing protein [Methylophaga sp.]